MQAQEIVFSCRGELELTKKNDVSKKLLPAVVSYKLRYRLLTDDGHKSYKTVTIISSTLGVVGLLLFCAFLGIVWRLWKQIHTLRKIQQGKL
jgi:hypothetical protein